MKKELYLIPSLKTVEINEEADLLTVTMDGDKILDDDDDDDGGSDNPWDDALGKQDIWDED